MDSSRPEMDSSRPENAGQHRSSTTLLLLADGRFPAGGHAHSGGLEAAVELECLADVAGMEDFLRGRLATAGAVTAAFASAACAAARDVDEDSTVLDVLGRLGCELDARTASPVLRTVSRRLGRQLLRAGRAVWPCARLEGLGKAFPRGVHQPIAWGAVAAAAGLGPGEAALAAAHDAVAGPATAAVRLLGLDPFAVHATLARLATDVAATAARGTAYAHADPSELPAHTGPLQDISAEHHATWEVRLFAS